MFTKYVIAEAETLPPIDANSMIEFVLAGNGIFVRARRQEMEAMIPVSWCEIRGLKEVRPYVRIHTGKVPLACTQAILAEFVGDLPNESLVWLKLVEGRLRVLKPWQISSRAAVHPADPYDPDGAAAFVDVHSHNTMEPFFSTEDDRDETGFRIFAVFGRLDTRPRVAARIGIYGYYWRLRAEDVFELPEGVLDVVTAALRRAGVQPAEMEVGSGSERSR
jgi:PRTRC genetic system protein A